MARATRKTSTTSSGTAGSRQAPARPAAPVRLGIDLGTTRTVAAVADRGNYPVVGFTDAEGDPVSYLPSLTALTDDGLVHGFEAKAAARRGAPLLRSLKRVLSAPDVSWRTPVSLGDTQMPVGEVLEDYLRYVRARLEASPDLQGADLSDPRHSVAVAVPAHAHSAQRLVTLDAFGAAGFHVTAMLNEPSAAGFEYSHRQAATVTSKRTRILVYDLGGGTFDTSLIDVAGLDHEVIASRGLPDLGGDDIDLLIARLVLARAAVAEADLGPREIDELLDQCRQAKEGLSPQTRRLVIELHGEPVVLQTKDLYEATAPLLTRSLETMAPLVRRLEDGGIDLSDIAGVYLVGGASSFPTVARMLRQTYGRRVHRSPYPAASTAIGLAAAVDPEAKVTLVDRLSRALGVFREEDEGRQVSFDPLLDEDAVIAGAHREPTVVERRYQGVHNIARLRFVEGRGDDVWSTAALSPVGEVLLPLEASLREVEDLSQVPVHRIGDGPWIHERYEADGSGVVRATFTNLEDGWNRTVVLGEQTSHH